MKSSLLIIIAALFYGTAFSQTADQGKKYLYYERYNSARTAFSNLLAANPNDETAAYYYGQSLIGLEKTDSARIFYQQKLAANPNSPLLLAGMGHVELLQGNSADARNRFETAISLSQGKRIDVLDAVGLANSDPDSKNGDAAYAMDVLKRATALKGFKDPDVLVNLGDAYRKTGDGGSALTSYQAALAIDPNYARAVYRIGRLYQSQGLTQEPLYMRYYNQAIGLDPTYAPVYNTLFNYYYLTNVPLSAQYLDKALNNSDNDPKACYMRASIKYAQGLFADAVSQANNCISSGGSDVYAGLYGVKALAYYKLGDSLNARAAYEQYFAKQSPDKILAGDLANYGLTLLKIPGNEALAATYIERAVAADSLVPDKVNYLKSLATGFRDQKKFDQSAKYFNQILAIKPNYTNLDLYNAGYDYFRAGKFDSSMAVFTMYSQKYPDDMFGYYMAAKASSGIDSTRTSGLAVNSYLKAIAVGEKATDPSKVKDYLAASYDFMSQYDLEVKKDVAGAKDYYNKALAIDPTNSTALALKDYIAKYEAGQKAPVKRTTK